MYQTPSVHLVGRWLQINANARKVLKFRRLYNDCLEYRRRQRQHLQEEEKSNRRTYNLRNEKVPKNGPSRGVSRTPKLEARIADIFNKSKNIHAGSSVNDMEDVQALPGSKSEGKDSSSAYTKQSSTIIQKPHSKGSECGRSMQSDGVDSASKPIILSYQSRQPCAPVVHPAGTLLTDGDNFDPEGSGSYDHTDPFIANSDEDDDQEATSSNNSSEIDMPSRQTQMPSSTRTRRLVARKDLKTSSNSLEDQDQRITRQQASSPTVTERSSQNTTTQSGSQSPWKFLVPPSEADDSDGDDEPIQLKRKRKQFGCTTALARNTSDRSWKRIKPDLDFR